LQATSSQEAEHFRQAGYDGPIAVVGNGVDTEEYSPGDSSEAEAYFSNLKDRLVVLFMSRLSREKGLDLLIPAWADLARRSASKDALLVIAGPDRRRYGKLVEQMASRYDVTDQILLLGMVRSPQKVALLRRADILVLPSHSENFGTVIVEAMACGTPVVTTTATPWEEIAGADAGCWVAPEEATLSEALLRLMNMSPQSRAAMGKRGRDLVLRNYARDIVARKMITVFRCVLEHEEIPVYPEPAEVGDLCQGPPDGQPDGHSESFDNERVLQRP
jgi:glycosyltransferase involved in cell wall biosynthesis